MLQRGVSKLDLAAGYHLKVLLHVMKSDNPQAVASALACLRLFGIDLPAHPTQEQVQAEYETVWRNLDGRPIEDLIDLPLMIDRELQAAMQVFSGLAATRLPDRRQFALLDLCRMVNISLRHGISRRVRACLRLSRVHPWPGVSPLPRRCIVSPGSDATWSKSTASSLDQAKVYLAMEIAAVWTQPIATAIDFIRASLRAALETGDLTYAVLRACYHIVTDLLLRNDPLDTVWRESEIALDFVQKAQFRDMEDAIVPQQRFIATMQGRTATFSTFNDAQSDRITIDGVAFDEAAFEAQLTDDRMPTMICWYWIIKAKARFLSGDYAEALAAADKAKAPALGLHPPHFLLLDHYYYTALTMAALYENASADERPRWSELLEHRDQLREWADNYPPTFGDKHALVSAEIARLEGRDIDAMRLFEQAIQSARANGFVQYRGGRPRGSRAVLRGEGLRDYRSRPSAERQVLLPSLGAPRARFGSSMTRTRACAKNWGRLIRPPRSARRSNSWISRP